MVAASLNHTIIAFASLTLSTGAQAAPFVCSSVKTIPRAMGVGTRYVAGDASYSQIDKAAQAREQSFRRSISAPVSRIAQLADRWRGSNAGDRKVIAACLQANFVAQANAQAMMGAATQFDAFYREWMLASLAISWLKAQDGLTPLDGTDKVRAWLEASGQQVAAFNIDRLARGENNNHRYWGGVALMAIGRVTGDGELISTGRRMRAAGLGAVAADGTLPAELKRRSLAFHYHLFAATALSAMIGLDPQPVAPIQVAAMRRLAMLVVHEAACRDTGLLAKRTGTVQVAEDHLAQFYLIRPWVSDRSQFDMLVVGVAPKYQFLGGDLDWLLAQIRLKSGSSLQLSGRRGL